MSDTPRNSLSPAAVRSLLNAAARLRQQGDTQRARVVLRALAAQRPDDPRVWRALADVAENDDERRAALRRVVALVRSASAAAPETTPAGQSSIAAQPPSSASAPAAQPLSAAPPPATQPIASPSAPAPSPAASPPFPSAPPPSPPSVAQAAPGAPPTTSSASSLSATLSGESAAPADQASMPQPSPTAPPFITRYNWIGVAAVGVALLIFATLLTNARFPNATIRPTSTLILTTSEPASAPASSAPSPDLPASLPTTISETTVVPPRESPLATIAPTSAFLPAATTTPAPTSTSLPTLPAGTVILRDAWTLTLLRPDHAVVLNGPIGSQQPNGRFVLALVAVGNGGSAAAIVPPELFVLIDEQGNRYLPEPGLSTFYLETFGHGRYGDFSLDEAIPAGVGQVSVPVIFDVPVSTRGLTLHLGDSVAGWPVMGLPR